MRVRSGTNTGNHLPFGGCCDAGSRFSLSTVIWSLVGFILMIHFYSILYQYDKKESRVVINHLPLPVTHEMEEIDKEAFKMPPPRKKYSPRAVRRRGPRKPHSAVVEFLDDSSSLRSFFFPDHKSSVDPTKEGNDTMFFYPGRQWLDTDGNPIQAHGGGLLYVESTETYYWYGENKDGPTYHAHKKAAARVDIIGVGCYSSKDLWTWKNEGIVLPAEESNVTHDLYVSNVLERPKVIYNNKTGNYVMWMHIDDVNYTKASIGVAISDRPNGPFKYLFSNRPHGFDSRDMTLFKDDDGHAYIFYSSNGNSDLHVSLLRDDYLDVTTVMRKILVKRHREAPAVFKHDETYYMITSGCSGWAPNTAMAHVAESVMGPWETLGNPCVGGNSVFRMATFFSQGTYVVPLPGFPGFFIFMADRWNPAELRDSRYVWLPLSIGGLPDEPLKYSFSFPLWSRISIYWHRRWRLPLEWRISPH